MYREWLSACTPSTSDRRGAIAALLHTLPPENFQNLKYFLAFLHHVSLNSDVNKMTATNLAIVMAPNLIFSRQQQKGMLTPKLSNLGLMREVSYG